VELKTKSVTPFLSDALAVAASSLASLLWQTTPVYQTVSLYLGLEEQESPGKMPAVLITHLPGGNWLLEIPIAPLFLYEKEKTALILHSWEPQQGTDCGIPAFGPRRLICEPSPESLGEALIHALEDLLFCSTFTDEPKIYIGDHAGKVADLLGKQLGKYLSKHQDALALLPTTAFDSTDASSKDTVEKHQAQVAKGEQIAKQAGFSFFTTSGYLGLPRFLFLVDDNGESPMVFIWNGKKFLPCLQDEILESILAARKNSNSESIQPAPAAAVGLVWPKAMEKLGLNITINLDEEDDERS
jgi:hypothetical protein